MLDLKVCVFDRQKDTPPRKVSGLCEKYLNMALGQQDWPAALEIMTGRGCDNLALKTQLRKNQP